MNLIRQAVDERDLYALKSLHFEKLKGARNEERSIRLNDQWRLVLKLEGEGSSKTVVYAVARAIGIAKADPSRKGCFCMEFEIIFDGSHRGSDQDLLCCPRLPEKREAPPLDSTVYLTRGRETIDRVLRDADAAYALVRTCLQAKPHTFPELRDATQLTDRAITTAIQRLRRANRLIATRVRHPKRRGTPSFMVYEVRKVA